MIEMRWYVRNSDLDISMDHNPVYAKEQVLQYRQRVDFDPNSLWSEWRDVPVVVERDLGCP